MIEESSSEIAVVQRRRADAHAKSAWRTLVVLTAWAVAMSLRPAGGPELELLGDTVLAVGGWWATRPGARDGGPQFMRRAHWTSVLILPLLLGSYFVAWDFWRLVRGS